ncbi:MAG: type II secretion system F family protein [Eubacterium sp.]|nr:type II secretion system F family protein [Eubacterium sp.]
MINFLVIAYALFALIIVILILSKKGQEEDNNIRRMKSIGKEPAKPTDYKNVDTSFYERVVKPFLDKLSNSERYGENATKSARKKQQNAELAAKLRKAGLHISASNYSFFKTAFTAIMIVISFGLGIVLYGVLDTKAFIIMLIGIVLAVIGPSFFLNSMVKRHQKAIKLQLAETIDLMSVCMEAGLSFDASLVKISERMEGPLIDELMTVFRQVQLGKNRNDALKAMAEASDVKELKTFVSAVVQANQLGIPITNVLQAQAEQLRMDKSEEIKEVAAKVPTKMTIPTVIFVFPAIFLVILAPVVFSVMDTLSGTSLFG